MWRVTRQMRDQTRVGGVIDLEAVLAIARRDAADGAAIGRLAHGVVAAIRDAGLFKLFLPADLGGLALGLPETCAAIADVAAADGAAGWAVMIGAGPGWFAGHMEPALAAEVYGPAGSVVAGSGAAGTADPDGAGGWKISGHWRWCSGAPWATWFTFNAVTAHGETFTFAVPAADVRVLAETWDVRGLRATASWDAFLDGVLVPAGRTFRVGEALPVRPEPIFRVPFLAFAQATMAAVAVGLTRRVLSEWTALAVAKTAHGADRVLGDDPVARDRMARVTAAARAASRSLDVAVAAVWDACVDGIGPTADQLTDLQLAACHAVATGAGAGGEAWELAGMSALPVASDLGRAVDDLRAVSQNTVVAPARFTDAGASLFSRS